MEWYANEILSYTPCMRMANINSRRNLILDPNELNMRNNIAHINNESSDFLCLGDTAVLMQLLWDIITEDIFE